MSTKDDRAAIFVPAEIPAPPGFHPEFGYFCPSAQLRRKLRRVVMTAAAGMVIAAGTALGISSALAPHAGAGMQPAAPMVVAALQPNLVADDSSADGLAANHLAAEHGGAPATMGRAIPVAPVTDRSPAADRSRAQSACDDLAVSFLMPRCQRGRPGKSHMAASRAAGYRVATLPLGRTEATPMAAEQDRVEAGPATVVTKEASATLPTAKAAVAAKRPVKIAHKPSPGRDAGAEILAAAPVPEFGLFGLFHEPPRSGNGAWAMSFRMP
jgi:hypothetical protein